MSKQIAKSKRGDAERACEWWLATEFSCVYTIRALVSRYQRQDLFNCDVIGKDSSGEMFFAQVTTGNPDKVRARKRKLEKIPWQVTDLVFVLQMDFNQRGRTKYWYFKIWEYLHNYNNAWKRLEDFSIDKSWFKPRKNALKSKD